MSSGRRQCTTRYTTPSPGCQTARTWPTYSKQALRADPRSGTGTALLLIDLDRFKEINDTFGHHYGDELLAQVGPRLRTRLVDVDVVARLGGDEFAVLLPGVRSVEEAVAVAVELRAAMEGHFHVLGVDLDVEASVGVVMSGEHGQDATTLLQRADIAMYVAKTHGRGVAAYHSDVERRAACSGPPLQNDGGTRS